MAGFLYKDGDLLEFTIKEIEAGNPEVVNALGKSDFSSISVTSEPSNEEILIIPEQPSTGFGLGMVDVASNNQRVLNSSASQGSQGYEFSEQISVNPNYDSKLSNNIYDGSKQMNVPITFETINSQASCFNQENRKTDQEHLCTKLDDGCHGFHMPSGSSIHPALNGIVTANPIHAPDRNIRASYDRMITEIIKEQLIEQGSLNSVSATDTSATSSEMPNKITEHGVAHEGKCLYKCCVCGYKNEEKENIQIHNNVYPFHHLYCNACGEVDMDADSHYSEQTCKVCGKKFQCIGQLEQHTADHEIYFHHNCRVCGKKIDEHVNQLEQHSADYEIYFHHNCRVCGKKIDEHVNQDKRKLVYVCCVCKDEEITTSRCELLMHLFAHYDLRLFKCHICGIRYIHESTLRVHLEKPHLIEDPTIQ